MAERKNPGKPKDREPMSPEEKLFRVISGNKNFELTDDEDDFQEDMESHVILQRSVDWIHKIQERWRKWNSGLDLWLASKFKHWQPQSVSFSKTQIAVQAIKIKSLNKGLMVVIGVLILYLFSDLLFFRGDINMEIEKDLSSPAAFSQKNAALTSTNLDVYLQKIQKRNVFQLTPLAPPPPAEGGIETPAPVEPLPNPAPENYKLVGISWDQDEYVAMIEYGPTPDGAQFVREGDLLKDGTKIEDIKEYSVTLLNGVQRWELS